MSVVLRDTLDWSDNSFTGERIEMREINSVRIVPVHYVWLESGFVNGKVKVGVSDKLAVSGVHMLLGNYLAGGRVVPDLKIIIFTITTILSLLIFMYYYLYY